MSDLTVLDPSAAATETTTDLAPRPESLAGLVLGVLDNGKPNSDRFLELLVDGLGSIGLVEIVWARKPSIGRLMPAAIAEDLRVRCDVVVTGVGDCAGCCSCSVHDAISFERNGIPAAVICTDEFLSTARIAATAAGIPDYEMIVIDHPLGSLGPSELRRRAEQTHQRLIGRLAALVAASANDQPQ